MRYALGPTPRVERFEAEGGLPEAYGSERLLLAARDPHWLYVHWDLTREQQFRYNAMSVDRHLVLRVHAGTVSSSPASEVHVHPESRHWFVHVDRAGAEYVAELGYYRQKGRWTTIATSDAARTPPDAMSPDTTVEFTAIPVEVPMERLLLLVKEAVRESVSLAGALQELRDHGHPGLPPAAVPLVAEWTPVQERALAEVVSLDATRRVWLGSMEITELLQRQFARGAAGEMASMAAAGIGLPTSPAQAPGAVSSPGKPGEGRERGFWFNVNAELVVYGATEPDATVTLGGRAIRLRPDGSFS